MWRTVYGDPHTAANYHGDSQSIREGAGAQQEYSDALANIGGGWNTYVASLGRPNFTNPYSQAALLQAEHDYWSHEPGNVYQHTVLPELMRGRDVGYRASVNGAGLGLYSGATAGRRYRVGTDYLGDLGEIQRGYSAREQQKARDEAEAQHLLKARQDQIYEEGLRRWEESSPPPVPPPGDGGGGGGGGSFATVTVTNPRTGRKEKKRIGVSSNQPAGGGDPAHPNAYPSGVGAGRPKPQAPHGYHAYKGPRNQWWFAPNR